MGIRSAPKIGEPRTITERISLNECPFSRRRFGKPPQCYLNKVEVCSYNGLCSRCARSATVFETVAPKGARLPPACRLSSGSNCDHYRLTRRNGSVRCGTVSSKIVYSVRIGPPQPTLLCLNQIRKPCNHLILSF